MNVNLTEVKSRSEIDLVVWERGCGITKACGTGACAAATVCIDKLKLPQIAIHRKRSRMIGFSDLYLS